MENLFGGLIGIVLIIFMLVAGILWIVTPFLVFGINEKMGRLTFLMRETIKELQYIRKELKKPEV